MSLKVVVLLYLIFNLGVCVSETDDRFVEVQVKNGIIRGVTKSTIFANKEYHSFRGIPYAKPPLGKLRFLPPEKADNWTGVLDTIHFQSTCTQIEFLMSEISGSEDCLYLNVYVPVINSSRKLPVMFYTHGGAFYEGSGQTRLHGPDYLLEKDVIIVTSNFRLSIFGFLSLGDDIYSGNMGLKDQLMALKWTNENIPLFNGDPKRITIFGHSTGATMIHMMTITPDTNGLFQRAIILGSTAINTFSINEESHRQRVFDFAKTESNVTNYDGVIELLQTYNSEKLLRGIQSIEPPHLGRRKQKLFYAPVIESQNATSPFLTDYPENMLKHGPHRNIDIMFETTKYEMLFLLAPEYKSPELLAPFNEHFEIALPNNRFQHFEWDSSVYRKIVNEVREFYFGANGTVNNETFNEYLLLMSDIKFAYGIHRSAIDSVHHITGKTFYLRFMIDAKLNVLKQMFGMGEYPGGSHGDELGYLFKCDRYTDGLLKSLDEDSVERKSIDRMTTLVTNFAKYGNPLPHNDPPVWLPVTQDTQNYLEINNNGVTAGTNPNFKYYSFWDNLFAKYKSYAQPLVWPKRRNITEL